MVLSRCVLGKFNLHALAVSPRLGGFTCAAVAAVMTFRRDPAVTGLIVRPPLTAGWAQLLAAELGFANRKLNPMLTQQMARPFL